MRTNKIKEFYEAAVKEGKFSSKFFKGIEEISTEEELRNFIEEKVQPVAKEMGYNFSTDELVIYEKQMAKKITEQQLENISGGVDVKNLALGGIVSLMALGAGVAGATSTTSAMNPRTQNAQKTEPANVHSLPTQEEQSSTAQVSGSQIEQNENNTLTTLDSKIDETELMEKFYEDITEFFKNKRKDFIESIKNLQPKIKLYLSYRLNEFCADEYRSFARNAIEILRDNEYEKINEYYQNRKKQIDLIFTYKIKANNIIGKIEEDFKAQKDKLKLGNAYDEDFYKLIEYEINNINKILIDAVDNGSNENGFEGMIVEFKNRLNTKFKEKVMSKINVDKLKGAHKRAIKRKNAEEPLRNNKKPKFAHLLEKDSTMPSFSEGETEKTQRLWTPFAYVGLEISKRDKKAMNRIVRINKDDEIDNEICFGINFNKVDFSENDESIMISYTEIAKNLDEYYNTNGRNNTKQLLENILYYLKLKIKVDKSTKATPSLLNRLDYKFDSMPRATVIQRKCAAALYALLMICESGEYRSENGGKRERGVIRTLIKMVEQGTSEHPFGDAFGRYDEEGRYKEGFYTPSSVGGTARAQKVLDKNTKKFIPPQVIERDKKDTGYLELSSDSEETQNDD